MKINYSEMMYRMNCLASDLDSLYHQAAQKIGVSDSVMFVLYSLYENKGTILLNDIRKITGISKQTLNSAIRKLENEEIIYLEQKAAERKRYALQRKERNISIILLPDYLLLNVMFLMSGQRKKYASTYILWKSLTMASVSKSRKCKGDEL